MLWTLGVVIIHGGYQAISQELAHHELIIQPSPTRPKGVFSHPLFDPITREISSIPPLKKVLISEIKIGWSDFYDIQPPFRAFSGYPYGSSNVRIGGMIVQSANTRRPGQLFSTSLTSRLLHISPYQLSIDAKGQFTLITPHGAGVTKQSHQSSDSHVHEFGFDMIVARKAMMSSHLLSDIPIKYGLIGRIETTTFHNFITAHKRRSLLTGAMFSLGSLSIARAELSTLISLYHSFRFTTIESLNSFPISSQASDQSFQLSVGRYLVHGCVAEVTARWRPSTITLTNTDEYRQHGFETQRYQTTSLTQNLSIRSVSLALKKIF